MFLSGYNAFSKCLILGGDVHVATAPGFDSCEADPADLGTMIDGGKEPVRSYVLPEITTSEYHGAILMPNDADQFFDNGEDDDGEDAVSSLSPMSAATFATSFPASLGFSLASLGTLTHFRSAIGTARSCGPATMNIMRDIEAAMDARPWYDTEAAPAYQEPPVKKTRT